MKKKKKMTPENLGRHKLTSRFGFGFSQTRLFLNKESYNGFISYFVFPLKKINKISVDSNLF